MFKRQDTGFQKVQAEHGGPFTLVCADCDAGDDVSSFDQALAAGWSRIEFAPDLPMANYVGLCPACREERAERLLSPWPE